MTSIERERPLTIFFFQGLYPSGSWRKQLASSRHAHTLDAVWWCADHGILALP